MTARHELTTTGKQEKFAHIFNDVDFNDKSYTVPTEDEQFAREREDSLNFMADFFGLDQAGEEQAAELFSEQKKDADVVVEQVIVSEEKLNAFDDKTREKEYEERQFTYRRDRAERENLTEPSWSTSTDRVIEKAEILGNINNRAGDHLRSEVHRRSPSAVNDSTSTFKESASTLSSNSSTTRTAGPKSAMDEFRRMNERVTNLGAQRTNRWKNYQETEEEYFAQFAGQQPWWKKAQRKVKNFFKGGKGRITVKMGIVIALQMGMAVFGKKYEFEGKSQMFGMFTLMLASFFMTRELAEEGLDVSGMIF